MEKTNYEALVDSTQYALARGAVTNAHFDAIVNHIKHSEEMGLDLEVYKLTKLCDEVRFELKKIGTPAHELERGL